MLARDDRFFHLRFEGTRRRWLRGSSGTARCRCRRTSRTPADAVDAERYQTVYARHPGAVAAPTAGLHFDDALLAALDARGIGARIRHAARRLRHVPAGEARRPRARTACTRERYRIPAETAAAVGQTRAARAAAWSRSARRSLRALEAAGREDGAVRPGAAETDLFILPGYRFRVVDRLLTNFHLPRSTLLMLVSAFAGPDAHPARRTGTPSRSDTAFSAMATRCCSTGRACE